MSDYFDHLAAIAFGTVPSLAPRTAARFESAAIMEIDPFAEHSDPAQPRPGAMEAPPAAGTAAPADSSRPPRVPNPPDLPAGRVEAPLSDPSPAVPGQPATPAPERPVVEAEVTAPGHVPQAGAPPEPTADVRINARRSVRQVPPTPHHPHESPQEPPPPAEPASTLPGPWADPDQATSFDASSGPSADIGPGPETPSRSVVLEHPSGRATHLERPVPGTRAETRQGAPMPATIQVTIGRVEVRAVQPPAPTSVPSPRPVAKPPALTLDDYLASRDGGSS